MAFETASGPVDFGYTRVYFHDVTDPGSEAASSIRQRPVGSPARPRVTPS